MSGLVWCAERRARAGRVARSTFTPLQHVRRRAALLRRARRLSARCRPHEGADADEGTRSEHDTERAAR